MSIYDKTKNTGEALAECHKKLMDISNKVSCMKKKYCAGAKVKGNPKEDDKMAYKQEDHQHILFKKEAESIENDIFFMKALVDGVLSSGSSMTSKFIKKFLPGKVLGPLVHDPSEEFKTSVLTFSTKFLEDKVNSLENLAKCSKRCKKKHGDKHFSKGINPQHRDEDISFTSDSGNSLKTNLNTSVDFRCEIQEKSFSSSLDDSTDQTMFKTDVYRTSEYTLDLIDRKYANRYSNRKKCEQLCSEFQPYSSEKFVQTDGSYSIPKRFFVESSEKYVQTDSSHESSVMDEVFEALKKISGEYCTKDKAFGGINTDSLSEDSSIIFKQEFDRSNPSNTYSGNASRHDYIVNAVLTGSIETLEEKDFVELLENFRKPSTNCDMRLPLTLFTLTEKRKEVGQRINYHPTSKIIPFVFHLNESESNFSNETSLKTSSTPLSSKIQVQVLRSQVDEGKDTNILQIDYCHNSQNIGRITLTDFSGDQNGTQSEILGRIVTYLLGLPPPPDKT